MGAKGSKMHQRASTSDLKAIQEPSVPDDLGLKHMPAEVVTRTELLDNGRKRAQSIYQFEEGSELGEGAFGKVGAANHKESGERVAVKTVAGADYKAGREIEILAFLSKHQHENIIQYKEAFVGGDRTMFVVMELIDGGDVHTHLNNSDDLDEPFCAKVMKGLLSALSFCHSLGVSHGDIKPENVLLSQKDGEVIIKLTDFGAATFFKGDEKHSKLVASPDYVAPEVLKGSYLPDQAELWSVGAMLYTMLCGDTPFSAPTQDLTIHRVETKKLEINRQLKKKSSACINFLVRLLNRNPDHRLTAAEALEHPWIKSEGTTTEEMELLEFDF